MISTRTAEIGEICLETKVGAVAQVRNDLLILGREKCLGFLSQLTNQNFCSILISCLNRGKVQIFFYKPIA